MKFQTLFASLLSVFLINSAVAESARIELKWEEGKTYRKKMGAVMSMKLGGEEQMSMNMSIEQEEKPEAHKEGVGVATSYKNLIMRMNTAGQKMQFDTTDPEKNTPELAEAFGDISKIGFTVVYSRTGKLKRVEKLTKEAEAFPEMDKESLESDLCMHAQLIPNREIKVGETWEAKVAKPMPNAGADIEMLFKLKLEKVETKAGKKVAVVTYEGEFLKTEFNMAGTKLKLKKDQLEGKLEFDIEIGQIIRNELIFKFGIVGDDELRADMDMSVKLEMLAPKK